MPSPNPQTQKLTSAIYFIGMASLIGMLAGSRWLAKIPFGHINLSEVLVAITGLSAAFLLLMRPRLVNQILYRPEFWVLMAVPTFALAKFLFSSWNILAAYEFYPFALLFLGPIFLTFQLTSTEENQTLLVRIIVSALVVHWIWVSLVNFLGPPEPASLFGARAEFFTVRADVDAVLLGVLSGLLLFWGLAGPSILKSLVLMLLSGLLQLEISWMGTKAGQISGIAILLSTFLVSLYQSDTRKAGWKKYFAGLLVFSSVALGSYSSGLAKELSASYIAVSSEIASANYITTDFELDRLTGQEVYAEPQVEEIAGTSIARLRAWKQIVSAISSSPSRAIFGGSFGDNYFEQSGAKMALEGPNPTPVEQGGNRWPHNWFLSLAIFLGIPASIFLLLVVVLVAARLLWRAIHHHSVYYLIALQILVGLVVASSFGVVAEMPFGAIPIAWALGVGIGNDFLDSRVSGFSRLKL